MDNVTDRSAGGPGGALAAGLSVLSDDELTVGYDEVIAASRRAEWDRVAFEAEIDRREMYRTDGTRSLREWISMRTGEGDRAAYHQAIMARTLRDYPLLSDALATGRLSAAHVRLLLRLARLTGGEDADLVEAGDSHTVAQLETACRRARPVSRDEDQEADRRRYLRWVRDDKGTFRLSGRLHGIDGLTVTNLLSTMAENAHPEADPVTGTHAPFDTRCADALVDLCAGTEDKPAVQAEVVIHVPVEAVIPDADRAGPVRPEGAEPDDADREDVASDAADGDNGPDDEGACDDRRDGAGPTASGGHGFGDFDRRDFNPYGPGWAGSGEGPMTWDGTVLSNDTLRRLLCDSRLRVTLDDDTGRAVGIGRRSRVIPDWMVGQLRWRDQGCRFPGCERIRWLHAHHLVHWAHGGPTDLSNTALLCSRHHRAVHEGDWKLAGDPDGELIFTAPTGQTFRSRPALRPANLRRRRRRRPRRERTPAPP